MSSIDPNQPLRSVVPAAPKAVQAADVTAPTAPVFGTDTRPETEPLDLTGLSVEEAQFVQQGFLPRNFSALRKAQKEGGKDAAIALAREGLKGPFSKRYGDPDVMMDGARRLSKHPDFSRLVKEIKPGDILVSSFNKDNDVISTATKGPFIHALVCVQAGPPPEFIEAIGLSGDVKDPDGNKVLRSMMSEQGWNDQTIRLMRPTANLPPVEADKAIKRAIAYCEAQLGKPYDFALTNTNTSGMNDAFYCSELAYKAYALPKGADFPFALDKASERDDVLNALSKILGGLKPDDQGSLTFQAAQLSATKGLTNAQLVDFIANKVLPHTEATRAVANTPERRKALEVAVQKVIEGKAFTNFESAIQRHGKEEQGGRFKGVAGFFRSVAAKARVGIAGIQDIRGLTKDVGFWRMLDVSWKLARTLVPHMETLTTFFFGPNDPRTATARKSLDALDGMARDAHRVPLLGKLWPLPSRPRRELNQDFVSPTDLAWADVAHWDFNVKAATPVDKAAVEARKK